MKAIELADLLLKYKESEITLSMSNLKIHLFIDNIIEITEQSENQITIVADIDEEYFTLEDMKESWENGISNGMNNINDNGYYVGKEKDFYDWIEENYKDKS